MGRRYQRVYARFRVALVSAGETGKFEQAGSVVDVCQHGLRVQTGPRLIPGQVLHLFHEGQGRPFARCRVVWAQTHGAALPSEAGLEILERHPMLPAAARLLSPCADATL
jgi:hypothetical protein